MQKLFAVAMTAALVLPAVATSAAAQDEKITVEGVVFFDHNGNEAFDAGEPVRADSPGVSVRDLDADKIVGEFPTDANGRYRAVLPKGPRYLVVRNEVEGYNGPWGAKIVQEDRTLDFPLWGRYVSGISFVDANGDGVKQADERTVGGRVQVAGETSTKKPVKVEAEIAADGSYHVELPEGDYTLTAPDLTGQGLAVAKPLKDNDVDWLTGQAKVLTPIYRIDLRYFEPEADVAAESIVITPAKDTHTVGEEIGVDVKLTNKGDVPGTLSFVLLGTSEMKFLAHSPSVTGSNGDYETVAKILPGQSVTVGLKLEFVKAGSAEIWPFARPWVNGHKDVDRTNQGVQLKKTVNVVEKTTTEPSTSPSSSEATTPTTTTTTPAVAQEGSKSGLASTGASPLGFLALGALLLAAGVSAFFVARRRRS